MTTFVNQALIYFIRHHSSAWSAKATSWAQCRFMRGTIVQSAYEMMQIIKYGLLQWKTSLLSIGLLPELWLLEMMLIRAHDSTIWILFAPKHESVKKVPQTAWISWNSPQRWEKCIEIITKAVRLPFLLSGYLMPCRDPSFSIIKKVQGPNVLLHEALIGGIRSSKCMSSY